MRAKKKKGSNTHRWKSLASRNSRVGLEREMVGVTFIHVNVCTVGWMGGAGDISIYAKESARRRWSNLAIHIPLYCFHSSSIHSNEKKTKYINQPTYSINQSVQISNEINFLICYNKMYIIIIMWLQVYALANNLKWSKKRKNIISHHQHHPL